MMTSCDRVRHFADDADGAEKRFQAPQLLFDLLGDLLMQLSGHELVDGFKVMLFDGVDDAVEVLFCKGRVGCFDKLARGAFGFHIAAHGRQGQHDPVAFQAVFNNLCNPAHAVGLAKARAAEFLNNVLHEAPFRLF